MTYKTSIEEIQTRLKQITFDLKRLDSSMKSHPPKASMPERTDTRELHSNIRLAYRHLEDAEFRLYSAIQYYDGEDPSL